MATGQHPCVGTPADGEWCQTVVGGVRGQPTFVLVVGARWPGSLPQVGFGDLLVRLAGGSDRGIRVAGQCARDLQLGSAVGAAAGPHPGAQDPKAAMGRQRPTANASSIGRPAAIRDRNWSLWSAAPTIDFAKVGLARGDPTDPAGDHASEHAPRR